MSTDSPQIQEIKNRYKASFPEKLTLLSSIKETVMNGEGLDVARDELHKLAGSSGMYGYADIAANCRLAMQKVENQQAGDVLPLLDQIIDLIEQES